jgi:hypothetical protein
MMLSRVPFGLHALVREAMAVDVARGETTAMAVKGTCGEERPLGGAAHLAQCGHGLPPRQPVHSVSAVKAPYAQLQLA